MELKALHDKWNSKYVTGEEQAPKPGLIPFYNTVKSLTLLRKHLLNRSKITVHCDVDIDGIGSGFIATKFIRSVSGITPGYLINKEKEHGISARHCEYFKNNPVDLLIIVDSSSNEVEHLKNMNCDVIVVDHHEVDHSEYSGKTYDGHDFVIVNNIIDNKESGETDSWVRGLNPESARLDQTYIADSRMSCGLVIYELLRVYQEAYKTGPVLENLMLYQWVGVTLITDAIQLISDRNQWYMDNTVHSMNTEKTLIDIVRSINPYAVSLTKSIIGYTMAPAFNRAIRAGASGLALYIVMENPSMAGELAPYRDIQDNMIAKGIEDAEVHDTFVLRNLENTDIGRNYTGVIAARLEDEYKRNAIAFIVEDGVAKGSFRGRQANADYRSVFNTYGNGVTGQGHKQAFGFKAPVSELNNVMKLLTSVESNVDDRPYLTAGNLPYDIRGRYHIDNWEDFKKAGGLMALGFGNSKVSSDEQINISVSSSDIHLVDVRGKLFMYELYGLSCKAFKEISPGIVNVYVEYGRTMDLFLK